MMKRIMAAIAILAAMTFTGCSENNELSGIVDSVETMGNETSTTFTVSEVKEPANSASEVETVPSGSIPKPVESTTSSVESKPEEKPVESTSTTTEKPASSSSASTTSKVEKPASSSSASSTSKIEKPASSSFASTTSKVEKPASSSTTTTTKPADPSVNSKQPEIPANAVYVSANGNKNGNGSKNNPYDFSTAITKLQPGGTIACEAGTYKIDSTIKINSSNSGSKGKMKTITSYNGDVILDFSGQSVSSSNRGISMGGDYWHWYGITIQNAGDNGMILGGSNNIIEMCVFQNNQDTGLQISRIGDVWPANNLILNCTSRNNCDDATMENADGFAAKLTCGEGNIFDGCISYNNSDDGWDLYAKTDTGPIGVVTLRNCVSFRNGYTEDGRGYGDCDGNGFKLGGSGVGTAHVVENCVAFENWHCGFVDNNNPKLYGLKNCTAYNNCLNGKSNFRMYRATNGTYSGLISYNKNGKGGNDTFVGEISNSVYYYNKAYNKVNNNTSVNQNSVGSTTTAPSDKDFVSMSVPAMNSVDFHKYWRNKDGSVNLGGFLEVVNSSSYYGTGAVFN